VSVDQREGLPDSLIVLREDGVLVMKSNATRHMLKRLGGVWAWLGGLLGLVPRPIRDWGYDLVAKLRHRLFKKPDDACPIVPAQLRKRFLR
jgi:predicted DCC family thiol-disulfide oxidoreductase YuxK